MRRLALIIPICLYCSGCGTNSDPVLAKSVGSISLFCALLGTGIHNVLDTLLGRRLWTQRRLQELVAVVCGVQVIGSAVCYALTRSFLSAFACAAIAVLYLFIGQLTEKILLFKT